MSHALHDLGVTELTQALRDKQVSATELSQHLLARIDARKHLGAFLQVNTEAALAQARAADAALAAGTAGPLAGMPIAHKDIFVTRGQPTTAGSKMLQGYRSPFDA